MKKILILILITFVCSLSCCSNLVNAKGQSKTTLMVDPPLLTDDLQQKLYPTINFYGGNRADDNFLDVIKTFQKIDTVTSIKLIIPGLDYIKDKQITDKLTQKKQQLVSTILNNSDAFYLDPAVFYSRHGVEGFSIRDIAEAAETYAPIIVDIKNTQLDNNLFQDVWIKHSNKMQAYVGKVQLDTNKIWHYYDPSSEQHGYITVKINTIYLEGIPFQVLLHLKPSYGYWFYNQTKPMPSINSSKYGKIDIPIYFVSDMVLEAMDSHKSAVDGEKVVIAYLQKYGNYHLDFNTYIIKTPNMTLSITKNINLTIKYENHIVDEYEKKLKELAKQRQEAENKKLNSIDKI